jgi:hypothetical protein
MPVAFYPATSNTIYDRKKAMNVYVGTNPDGSIRLTMPQGTPPDGVAFNLNVVRQMERKSKMIARLRAKLDN